MNKSEILSELRKIENDLSPENLACDGELSQSKIIQKRITLNRKRSKLIKLLGYVPSDKELYPD